MQRREFITLLGGAAAAWPLAASAQQPEPTRRIGLFSGAGADDPNLKTRQAVFRQRFQELGWTDGRNVRIDYRFGEGDTDLMRRQAAEIVALAPDVIVSGGGPATERMLEATRTVPIVFVVVPDPVGSGLVARLSRPGGNATGFMQFEYGLSGKWLELLKQIAPGVTRVAVLRDPKITSGIGQFAVIQSVAPSVGVEVSPININDLNEVERTVADFAREPNGGLILTASALSVFHGNLIIALAARQKLPAVYYAREFAADGGLISYGPNFIDQYRLAAGYVDRILRGEKPGDLPVQAPNKCELLINLRTAKALGLSVPQTLLARADEVIE